MNNYYLKINYIIKDNKKVIESYDLYNGNNLIKEIDYQTSDVITQDLKKDFSPKIIKFNSNYIINDLKFIKKYIDIPKRKISHNNKFAGKTAILAVSTATLLSITALANSHYNDNNINNTSSITTYYYPTNNNDNNESTAVKVYFDDLDHSKPIINDEIIYSEAIKNEIKEQPHNESTYSFNYEDRSSDNRIINIQNLYGNSIKKYSNQYGIDEKLIYAIILQENPDNTLNYSNIGGHGIMQIESIWNNEIIRAYNFETNNIEELTIDTNKATEDPDYCIKVGCMIFNNYYNYLNDTFGDKLDDKTLFVATLFAYNKGISQVSNSLTLNVFNLDYFLGDIKNSSGGDNYYDEHVLSFISDQVISLKDKYGNVKNILVDNLQKKGNQL